RMELRVVGEKGWGGTSADGWVGRVSDEELARLYRGARCLVYPSLYEGFGLPVAEAMACGTPVVASAGGALEEVADGAAVLVDPRDPGEIAAGIEDALTRRPELVPEGVEPVELSTWSQELRMGILVPLLLRRLRPALAHFQHALPLTCPCPAVVTVHDLSFERDPSLMPLKDRLVFRRVVPRAARRAARVFTVSERTKRDLVELYGIPDANIVVTPNGVDPAFGPGERSSDSYLLFVGAIQERKNPLAAADAAAAVGLPLLVAGPEREPRLARELERRGAKLRGYVSKPVLAELYRGAAVVVLPSRYEGFGLPVLEAMA